MKIFNKLKQTMIKKIILCSLISLGASFTHASNMWDPSQSTCSTINCSAVSFNGTVLKLSDVVGGTNVLPWIGQIWSEAGECLRIDLTSMTGGNLEMVVVSPNGTLYRNDNRSASNLKPLLKIDSTPITGYYTLHISTTDGVADTIDFTILFGRYNTGNTNCAAPTPAL